MIMQNDNSNEIYLEVTQTTLLCPAVGRRHSRHKRAGYEGGVQLHDAVVDFFYYGLQQSVMVLLICCWQWQ